MTFDEWWDKHGQYVRAGGGQYEISFAFAAWNASRQETLEEAAQEIDKTWGIAGIAYRLRKMKEAS